MAESWLFAKNPTSRVVKVVIGSMSVIAILQQLPNLVNAPGWRTTHISSSAYCFWLGHEETSKKM